jgi:multidrug resistance protein
MTLLHRRPASLGAIFLIVLLDLLGFGILIPQIGVYGVKLNASPWTVGLLVSTYSLMQLLAAPILGGLSDRYGRRPVLLYSLAGSMLGYLLFAVAHSLPLLFLSRIVDGISGGNIATAQAYVSDITTEENRARGMGLVGAAFGLGFILGPSVGGILGAWGGNLAIGLAAAGLSALNWVLAYTLLPETHRAEGAHSSDKSIVKAWAQLKMPGIGAVLVATLLFVTAFAQMEGTFSVLLIERYVSHEGLFAGEWVKEASWRTGYIFAAVGVVSALVQGVFIGRLRKRFGEPALACWGMALAALALALVPLAPSYLWLYAPMMLLAVGSGLANPSLSTLASLKAAPGKQGATLGAFQAMGSLGRTVGPALGGTLFSVRGPAAPYWVASAMAFLAAAWALKLLPAVYHGRGRTSPAPTPPGSRPGEGGP